MLLVIATRNPGKLREIRELLEPHGIEVLSLADFDDVPEVEETGETFAENAALKATEIAKHLKKWTLGEDSGLMVDALGGKPGIYSARFSGPDATDEKNNAKLIEELAGVPEEKRGAQYVCSLAVSAPNGEVQLTEEAAADASPPNRTAPTVSVTIRTSRSWNSTRRSANCRRS